VSQCARLQPWSWSVSGAPPRHPPNTRGNLRRSIRPRSPYYSFYVACSTIAVNRRIHKVAHAPRGHASPRHTGRSAPSSPALAHSHASTHQRGALPHSHARTRKQHQCGTQARDTSRIDPRIGTDGPRRVARHNYNTICANLVIAPPPRYPACVGTRLRDRSCVRRGW